jgi:hypothetical protein
MSVASRWGLLARVFFLAEDFCGEPFLFFDVSVSVGGILWWYSFTFSLFFSFFPSSFFIYFISSSSRGRDRSTFFRGIVLLISLYVLDFLLFLLLLRAGLSDMLGPGDQGDSYNIGFREFCIINRYKELCRPLLRDLFHIFVCQLIVRL